MDTHKRERERDSTRRVNDEVQCWQEASVVQISSVE